VAPQVFRAMGCEVEELFCEVDGYFPNHHPDPTVPANLDALISLVRLQGADLGLAFDGDGDRLGVVDGRGNIIWPDRQMMLLAREVLMRSPGSHVVFDVKCSAQLAQFVTEHAGVPLMWKSGHSMIRSKMQEVGALLAGDMSGHIFLADRWYGFDDAIYAGARVLEILSADGRSSADLFAELPDMLTTPEIRVHLNDGEAERIMDSLGEGFANSFSGARVTTVDGVRVDLADSWALVRASNTEPCLVLRFEGSDQEAMERIQEAFRSRLLAIKPDLQLPF
jgi:phosphomannomutase/phosphoglucomutase